MPEFDNEEFKFPDEAAEKNKPEAKEPEFEIEIEDDTPAQDRGRQPMPKPLVDELEKDELDKYDDEVKTKLKQMRKVWHDERREKELALREQQEAINVAQRLLQENKRIKTILTNGEKEYIATVQNSANMELEMAKRAYREAYDSGDTDKMIEAQQSLQNVNYKLMQIKNFKLPPLQEEEFELYVKGVENEVNKCNSIGAIISFYDRQGYDTVDAYNIILDTVMNNSTLNK